MPSLDTENSTQLTVLIDQVRLMQTKIDQLIPSKSAFSFSQDVSTSHFVAPPPDPRLVKRCIAERQRRNDLFGHNLFSDPAWDILLDLTLAQAEMRRVSVSSVCIGSGVPPTTGLRWIERMVELGILARTDDPTDGRRAFISMSNDTAKAMNRYFHALL